MQDVEVTYKGSSNGIEMSRAIPFSAGVTIARNFFLLGVCWTTVFFLLIALIQSKVLFQAFPPSNESIGPGAVLPTPTIVAEPEPLAEKETERSQESPLGISSQGSEPIDDPLQPDPLD